MSSCCPISGAVSSKDAAFNNFAAKAATICKLCVSDLTVTNSISGGGAGCTSITTQTDVGSATTVNCVGALRTNAVSTNVFNTFGSGSNIDVGLNPAAFCSAIMQWDGAAWQIVRAPSITAVSVGPIGSGALYPDVATALATAPGCPFIRVLANLTEPAALAIPTSTIIYIDPGVTYTLNNTITLAPNADLIVMGNEYNTSSRLHYSLPLNTALVNITLGGQNAVSFRYLHITNNSPNNGTPVVTRDPSAIVIDHVQATITNPITYGFIGNGSGFAFADLLLDTVEINGGGSSLAIDTPANNGLVRIRNLVLTNSFSGFAVSCLQTDTELDGLVIQNNVPISLVFAGRSFANITRLVGSLPVTLTIQQIGGGTPHTTITNVNLGRDGGIATILALTTFGAPGIPRFSAANLIADEIQLRGNNISLTNVNCRHMPTTIGVLLWGEQIAITNGYIDLFDTVQANFTPGSCLTNIHTIADPATGLSIIAGDRVTIHGWHQYTGILIPNGFTNGVFAGVVSHVAAGPLNFNSCQNSLFSDFWLPSGMATNGASGCCFSNFVINGIGSLINWEGLNNRFVNIREVNAAANSISITGDGHEITNCQLRSAIQMGTGDASGTGTPLTNTVFANNHFEGAILFGGPPGVVFTNNLNFANNRFGGLVSLDANYTTAQPTFDITFTGNTFLAAVTIALITSLNHQFAGNRFTNVVPTVVAGIPAANAPLFTGNWGTGAAIGPANAHANSIGNT